MKKLLTFEHTGFIQWGVLTDREDGVYSTAALEEAYFIPFPETLLEFIEQENDGLLALATVLEQNADEHLVAPLPLDVVNILAPIPQVRRNIFCIGKNYADHIREFDKTAIPDIPKYPVVFTKATNTIIGPNQTIDMHSDIATQIDYEGELAIIIGKSGKNIHYTEAMDHIYGYTIMNDITARDLQANHLQWFLGKSLDTFAPMGPYILLRDAAPESFTVTTKVNGEVRQDGDTEELIFPITKLIETLSAGITLEVGDIIATGTPAGVGIGFKPPRLLKTGDTVSVSIAGIGTLTNKTK
jgi:2-keto-4-pentenoate hydratase/2-oxohepta-3-ene-1,7-dioic acid hydratase in catechol pathway